jgi:hypothetical protein
VKTASIPSFLIFTTYFQDEFKDCRAFGTLSLVFVAYSALIFFYLRHIFDSLKENVDQLIPREDYNRGVYIR